MGSPLSRRSSRANTQEYTLPSRKVREQPVNPTHKLYRSKLTQGLHYLFCLFTHFSFQAQPCRNFSSTGYCRFGDNCSYLHVPPTPPSQSDTPLSSNIYPSPASALSSLQSLSPDKATLPHIPSSFPDTTTDATSDHSSPSSVEDLTTMMQQCSISTITSSSPRTGLQGGNEINLPPVPPCTSPSYDLLLSPQLSPGVRLVPFPVPVPVVPAAYRRGSESAIQSSPRSKEEVQLRSRSRSITYGVNLFKSKQRVCLPLNVTLLTRDLS